ncbi:MAG: helix-turn-helix transcriptional regulator [Ruminococcaceae bacterium]|nr:helix-turn-helix transcriptional regulator [Oscillospiraceae bacterium]
MSRRKRNNMEKFTSPFAINIRKLMEEREMTQDDLAKKISRSRQTVSQYVNGISEPGYETLVVIAKCFGVSTDYLLGASEITTKDADEIAVINFTGLSEDSVKTLHQMKVDNDQNQSRCADIGSNKPYLDWLNDLLDGFYLDEKLIATFYIALRRAVVNGGDWYKNNQNGKTNGCDNIPAEYACMKIGREVELLLRRKYRVEKAGAGGGYRRDFDSDVNTED